MGEGHKCEKYVWRGHYGSGACSNTAKFEHNGRWFCKTHHPPNVAAKQAAKQAARSAKWDEEGRLLREARHREISTEQAERAVIDAAVNAVRRNCAKPGESHLESLEELIEAVRGLVVLRGGNELGRG